MKTQKFIIDQEPLETLLNNFAQLSKAQGLDVVNIGAQSIINHVRSNIKPHTEQIDTVKTEPEVKKPDLTEIKAQKKRKRTVYNPSKANEITKGK
jgi:hypothetical protein